MHLLITVGAKELL